MRKKGLLPFLLAGVLALTGIAVPTVLYAKANEDKQAYHLPLRPRRKIQWSTYLAAIF